MARSLSYRIRRRSSERVLDVKPWHKFINWGSSTTINTGTNLVVNKVEAVRKAVNKLSTFETLKEVEGIRIPEFTTDRGIASEWIRDNKCIVVCRRKLSGHSGDGIVLALKEDDLVDAPLYVKYVKKQQEFRIHVAFGEVIDVQEKRKRSGIEKEDVNFQVRNHHTGWVYCREDVSLPDGAADMATRTVRALGLDFGAVDIIYNAKRDEVFVLEVNCAPGLEGTTVEKYAEVFVRHLN